MCAEAFKILLVLKIQVPVLNFERHKSSIGQALIEEETTFILVKTCI